MKSHGFRDTGRLDQRRARPGIQTPTNLAHLMQNLDSAASTALPLRPKGAGSASTDCNVAAHGTVINTIGLDQVRHIDACKLTVTA